MATKTARGDFIVTCSAGVNIAVIKYWGKQPGKEELILPLNSSLSATLSQDDLKSLTTILASQELENDEIWLNGKQEDIKNERIQNVLKHFRAANPAFSSYKLRIVSKNDFPTAAGLASSASGYCCMVYTLAQLFGLLKSGVEHENKAILSEISKIARVGSGSACRSMFGGWVKWDMGVKDDGSDSMAIQVANHLAWPEMMILVLVASDQRKHTGSSEGMQLSVQTSKKLKERVKVVPERMKQMEKAILEKDYETFAALTILDSDDMHACCADTVPSIVYLNDTSRFVQTIIKQYNAVVGKHELAYTFDAGPNAVLYIEKRNYPVVMGLIAHYFPGVDHKFNKFSGVAADVSKQTAVIDKEVQKVHPNYKELTLKYVLHTTVGDGPRLVENSHLINAETRQPIN